MITILLVLGFCTQIQAKPRGIYGKPLGIYKGKEGVTIVSFSKNWSTTLKLQEIYQELVSNFYAEEIKYLSHLYIYPDSPEGVAGYYYEDFEIDEHGRYQYKKGRYIEIFSGDEYTDISQMAKTISHEYGHHFTFYYLMTKENKYYPDWGNTTYGKIRNLHRYPEVQYKYTSESEYAHEWDVAEIAAEDYVQLFGSPLAKASYKYKDIVELAHEGVEGYTYYYSNSFNILPQENLRLPLAAEVKGLYSYWLTLAGYTTQEPSIPHKPKPKLTQEKVVAGHYLQYKIEWDEIQKGGPYEYTVIMYAADHPFFPRPLKTVRSGENMAAYFGSIIQKKPNGSTVEILEAYEGLYEFRVLIKNPQGFMFSSEPMLHHFSNPSQKKNSLFADVSYTHWARQPIEKLVEKEIITGYKDGTFRPDQPITKSEFVSLLFRSAENVQVTSSPKESHWFARKGYLNAAKQSQVLREIEYGKGLTEFLFDEPITREETAMLSVRFLDMALLQLELGDRPYFQDHHSLTYKKEVYIASKYKLTQGYPDKTFRPKQYTTRAEAAKLISQLLDITGGWLMKKQSTLSYQTKTLPRGVFLFGISEKVYSRQIDL